MAFFVWDEKFSVGVPSIDAQHKKLISLTDRLHEAMKSGKGNDALAEVLDSLIDYTVTHFAYEEKLMSANAYPGYLAHKVIHDNLTAKAKSIRDSWREGKPMVTVDLMNFLKTWLTDHIHGEDKKYSTLLREKGVQ